MSCGCASGSGARESSYEMLPMQEAIEIVLNNCDYLPIRSVPLSEVI